MSDQSFRNYAPFDTSLIPTQVKDAIQPCLFGGKIVHVMMTLPCHQELYLWNSPIERLPLLSIWDLYNSDDDQVGFLFQASGQKVSSSSSHLLIQSPSLVRQYSIEDTIKDGRVARLASNPHFNVFNLDLGATLVAQKALGFMSKVLDKETK